MKLADLKEYLVGELGEDCDARIMERGPVFWVKKSYPEIKNLLERFCKGILSQLNIDYDFLIPDTGTRMYTLRFR